MGLDEYRRKRDFTKTPEPAGTVTHRKGPSLFFCVQKHLASHLHYDFRIEYAGVLLSWAVPKGPSLDPTVKRLAMRVEDHPLEYGRFEGVIPEGYGAGLVMLWDVGTWTPEVDDVEAALRKGDLKLKLEGYKLKGSWVLVRTRDARTWLLIKHRDEWSGEIDITTFAPKSVESGGDFEDILAGKTPAVWRSNRPAKGGEAGALLARIIERAARLKAESRREPGDSAPAADAPRVARGSGMRRAVKPAITSGVKPAGKPSVSGSATPAARAARADRRRRKGARPT